MEGSLKVKFRVVDEGGTAKGLLASRGMLGGAGFQSKRVAIEVGRFVRAEARAERVIMWIEVDAGSVEPRVIEVYRPRASLFAQRFNRIASEARMLARQAEMEARGRAAEMRVVRCGACEGLIDLADFPEGHEAYCPYCETVTNAGVSRKEQEQIRRCDRCGYFSMPRTITCFYGYFLVVAVGWIFHRKHMCSACMRAEAWKMLAVNALFLIGVPVALTQLARAYFGGTALGGVYGGLEAANVAARKRRHEKALERYAEISARLGGSSIAAFNSGLALALADRNPEARRAFEASLRACPNFEPGGRALAAAMVDASLDVGTSPLLRGFLKEAEARARSERPAATER